MKKLIIPILAVVLALGTGLALAGCGNWETLTSGGIAIDSVERDADGYIAEDAVKDAALTMAEVYDEALCTSMHVELDKSADPVRYVVDFDALGTSYHYVVNAENGDLIDFSSFS